MTTRQLLALFVCSLVPWTVGHGLVPLLPVYATRLGADPALAGYYLAFSYLALAVGAIAGGWMSDRLRRRKLPLVAAGAAAIPIVWLMGRVDDIVSLTLLTALLWFCGGLSLSLVQILTGLSAGARERGKVFGILSLANGLAAVIGGLSTGFIVDRWGFSAMFSAMAGYVVIWPLGGALLSEKTVGQAEGRKAGAPRRSNLGKDYRLLFAASLVASIAAFVILLGRSLIMGDLGFGAFEISSTGAVSGVVAMPLPLLLAWLSDRSGRKVFLGLGYLAGVAGLAILAIATPLWQFFVVLVLQTMLVGVNRAVGNAMVTDLTPSESLGRGLALFTATTWLGAVLGFAGAGYALQHLGALATSILAMSLPLAAIVLLALVRPEKQGRGASIEKAGV